MNRGPYILTRSGIKFYPLVPRAADINIDDVAFALSNICRYGGHVDYFSVAEHSVLVSHETERSLRIVGLPPKSIATGAMLGLLHDAAEAYPPGDILGPMKKTEPFLEVVRVQLEIESMIEKKFGLSKLKAHDPERDCVRAADEWLLVKETEWLGRLCHDDECKRLAEREDFLSTEYGFVDMCRMVGAKPWPREPKEARALFLKRFRQLQAWRGLHT